MNNSFRVDDEECPLTGSIGIAIDAVKAGDRSFWLKISEERKVQFSFPAKGCVAPGTVHRNAEEFGPQFMKLREDFIIERYLVATDRTPICGIKDKDDRLPEKFAQANGLVRSAFKGKIGG
jgi:hypothetical protein